MKTEMQSVLAIAQSVPLVTLFIPPDTTGAAWAGKWHLNISSDAVRAMGGPWNTEAEAVAAVLKTGRWIQRPNTKTPHFDRA